MVRVYKPKLLKAISEMIGGSLLAVFIFYVRWEPVLTDKTAPFVAAFILLVTLLLARSGFRIRIEVTDEALTVYRGKKVSHFDRNTHGFGAKTTSDGTQDIIVYQPDGREDLLDCQFLSEQDFKCLTDDLAITGAKQKPVVLKTKEKTLIEE